MSEAYNQLLTATIRHLEELKARGARFVPVSAAALAALNQPPPRPRETRPTNSGVVRPPAAGLVPPPVFTPSLPSRPSAPSAELTLGISAPTAPPAAAPLDATDKTAAFADLRERVLACVKCPHLVAARKMVVFGVGNLNAELMFVGEAPGAEEDEQGDPFVGKAGQLLTKIIQTMGFRREDVYIGNILKCRPDTPRQAAGNRKPTPDEMKTCLPWLHEQIDLIRPRVLVALGATAVEGLLGKTVGITRLRGNWQEYRGIPLMPTYHPAYLLRNQALSEKRRVWEDMLAVMEKLQMPISEKQRAYFLPK